jgi:hypothetical protein
MLAALTGAILLLAGLLPATLLLLTRLLAGLIALLLLARLLIGFLILVLTHPIILQMLLAFVARRLAFETLRPT